MLSSSGRKVATTLSQGRSFGPVLQAGRQRKAAAIRLQCQLRRFFARREVDRRISHAAQRIRAATFIQRVYRARALQWSYAVKRAQLARERKIAKAKLGSSIKLQATWRMKQARYEVVVRRRAVSDIQRSTRGFLGRRRAAERKHALVTRIQRQYRRHRERMVILTALLAMRASREKKEERAREVERRFRALEEQRLGNTSGSEAIATPLDKRRAERAHKRLLRSKTNLTTPVRWCCYQVKDRRLWVVTQQNQAPKKPDVATTSFIARSQGSAEVRTRRRWPFGHSSRKPISSAGGRLGSGPGRIGGGQCRSQGIS
ncbi:hypothetical protein Esi_0025_0032 [Ectocarpus siliculosus]|uniref:Uncharacterized protein n=1 Tax=Ectocarpus siliculosus TaxID=2880 RepID=D7FTD2_ECTSI|nr:hypothetical protein Esi_0025_0032 [Ectocarpus siliculosus]|eukprot:CBJ48510.1 hypothetical protein Esi_0025_0032 [Ectocarpus siliculosus]